MDNEPRDTPNVGVDSPSSLLTIGWREYVGFPDWHIRKIKAKIDTGARTSALDVAGYNLREEDGLGLVAEMRLALSRKHPEKVTVVCAPVLRMVEVRNSGGVIERRPLIETTVCLGHLIARVPLTIASRAPMRFRMILGRKALEGQFLVDVSKQYLLKDY